MSTRRGFLTTVAVAPLLAVMAPVARGSDNGLEGTLLATRVTHE